MFGLPGETYETVRQSIQVMKKLPYDIIATFIAKPLPGSNWWNEWRQNKQGSEIDYDWFQYLEVKNVLEYTDGKYIIKLPIDAYREHFFRPIQILRYLRYWTYTFHFKTSVIGVLRRLFRQVLNYFKIE